MSRLPLIRDAEFRPEDELVGHFRRFGPDGVVYEVIGPADTGSVRIRVVESGETLDYPVAEVRVDPKA